MVTNYKKIANYHLLSSFFITILSKILGILSVILVIFMCLCGMQELSKVLSHTATIVMVFTLCAVALIFESFIQGGIMQYDIDLIEGRHPTVWTIFSRKDVTLRIAAINVAMLLIDCIIAYVVTLVTPVLAIMKLKKFAIVIRIVLIVIFNTSFFLAPFFIVDDKNVRTLDALLQSVDFMHGRKVDLALMYLSYFIEFALSVIFPPLMCYLIALLSISNTMFYLHVLDEDRFSRGKDASLDVLEVIKNE